MKRITQPSLFIALVVLMAGSLSREARARQDEGYFVDVTEEAGIDFVHDPGGEGGWIFPEVMGSGAAFLDFDNDGDLDIYLIQAGGPVLPRVRDRKTNRFFEQNADGTFIDRTAEIGLGHSGYGSGVAVGDIDNDGFVDVYVGNYGPDVLFHNQSGEKFVDITEKAGIGGDEWSASAIFCDYDRDGFLDLYVAHYSKHERHKDCVAGDGRPDYCSPQSYPGTPDTLYHNKGDGTFTDVSKQTGIQSVSMPGLGVVCSDFNLDGWMDFYVTNDGEANHLWENQGDGTFEEMAFLNGVALSGMGRKEAGMGVTLGDADGDGDLDLLMVHLKDQTHTLYSSEGELGFDDMSSASGLAGVSLPLTGFGVGFLDFNHDGNLDIAISNGRAYKDVLIEGADLGPHWSQFAEPNTLMENEGNGKYRDVSSSSGGFSAGVEIGRGMAFGDYDNDGDIDILTCNHAGPARLFRNEAPKKGSWLLVRAWDPVRNRDEHGAVVGLKAGGKEYVRMANPGYGYESSNDPRAHFGVPGADAAETLWVRWPDGTEEIFAGVELNQSIVLEKGMGTTKP